MSSVRVLVLGGYGAMAQSTVRDLLESKGVEAVGIAGRSEEKAKAFAKLLRDDRSVPTPVDIRERDRLARALKGWDVVINSAWYDLNVLITESAIRAGIHYTDLGGLYNETLKQMKLDKRAKDAGVTCLLGMGSTPGTMNVMGIYGAADGTHLIFASWQQDAGTPDIRGSWKSWTATFSQDMTDVSGPESENLTLSGEISSIQDRTATWSVGGSVLKATRSGDHMNLIGSVSRSDFQPATLVSLPSAQVESQLITAFSRAIIARKHMKNLQMRF